VVLCISHFRNVTAGQRPEVYEAWCPGFIPSPFNNFHQQLQATSTLDNNLQQALTATCTNQLLYSARVATKNKNAFLNTALRNGIRSACPERIEWGRHLKNVVTGARCIVRIRGTR
jgi:hypothetical protein